MELSIDTASELASIALSQEGALVAEMTWRCRRNHTVELLPSVERLLGQAGASKADLTAVFVCTGPGMYTGLRVGVTVVKALAHALALPSVGVGRLVIILPEQASVEVRTRVGAGDSVVLGSREAGTSLDDRFVRHHLNQTTYILDLEMGIGEIFVTNSEFNW